MEIIIPSGPNGGRSRLQEVVVQTRGTNCKAFTGEVLVFCIGGRLRKLVTHIGSTVQYTHLPRAEL